ncbi:MAG: DUF86 domain-containing protein [Chloroflexi bacterium]|nr:DUF86 domain-containing protein [Chloroflexota bacterium]
MYDVAVVGDVLREILAAIRTVAKRFAPVRSVDDFVQSEAGLEKLDAICMQLIAIGESIKRLDKITGGTLLPRYPQVEWKRVMGMRDVLTHHYFDLDAEVVYSVCAHHIGTLEQTVAQMLADLDNP